MIDFAPGASWVLAPYALMSVVTFTVYAADKSAARRGAQRVPESTLHVLSLLGGWPGALAAQQMLRHKTRKQPFRAVFWATVAINCLVLAWALIALTPPG